VVAVVVFPVDVVVVVEQVSFVLFASTLPAKAPWLTCVTPQLRPRPTKAPRPSPNRVTTLAHSSPSPSIKASPPNAEDLSRS
jgi:hypothetical protein